MPCSLPGVSCDCYVSLPEGNVPWITCFFSLNSNILPHPRPRPPRLLHCKHCPAPVKVPFSKGRDRQREDVGKVQVEVYTGVEPKIGGKPPKMDGENNGKPY